MKIISIISKQFHEDKYSDGYELRLDLFNSDQPISNIINQIKQQNKIIIITLRENSQGGRYTGTQENKLSIYNKIASENKEYEKLYFDFEYIIDKNQIKFFLEKNANSKIIYSYHNFDSTPNTLQLKEILSKIKINNISENKIIYKIVTKAENSLDSLELIKFLKNTKAKLIAHCMGEHGKFSRIINGIFGSEFTYGVKNYQSNIPNSLGCISTEELNLLYRVKELNRHTKIYALIGNPVSESIGHKFHNQECKNQNENNVYIKITLKKEELEIFFKKIPELNFSGLSITMPLKELAFNYISNKEEFEIIQVINTIKICNNKLLGINTDGDGAYTSLKQFDKLEEFKFLFIGCGGAVEGIIDSLTSNIKNYKLYITNRTIIKAEQIQKKFEKKILNDDSYIKVISFEEILNSKDILENKICIINAVSNTAIKNNPDLMKVLKSLFTNIGPDSVLMDLNYYNDIIHLVPKNIKAINGYCMFNEQAKLQQRFWCDRS